jgi:hypothetical protein
MLMVAAATPVTHNQSTMLLMATPKLPTDNALLQLISGYELLPVYPAMRMWLEVLIRAGVEAEFAGQILESETRRKKSDVSRPKLSGRFKGAGPETAESAAANQRHVRQKEAQEHSRKIAAKIQNVKSTESASSNSSDSADRGAPTSSNQPLLTQFDRLKTPEQALKNLQDASNRAERQNNNLNFYYDLHSKIYDQATPKDSPQPDNPIKDAKMSESQTPPTSYVSRTGKALRNWGTSFFSKKPAAVTSNREPSSSGDPRSDLAQWLVDQVRADYSKAAAITTAAVSGPMVLYCDWSVRMMVAVAAAGLGTVGLAVLPTDPEWPWFARKPAVAADPHILVVTQGSGEQLVPSGRTLVLANPPPSRGALLQAVQQSARAFQAPADVPVIVLLSRPADGAVGYRTLAAPVDIGAFIGGAVKPMTAWNAAPAPVPTSVRVTQFADMQLSGAIRAAGGATAETDEWTALLRTARGLAEWTALVARRASFEGPKDLHTLLTDSTEMEPGLRLAALGRALQDNDDALPGMSAPPGKRNPRPEQRFPTNSVTNSTVSAPTDSAPGITAVNLVLS